MPFQSKLSLKSVTAVIVTLTGSNSKWITLMQSNTLQMTLGWMSILGHALFCLSPLSYCLVKYPFFIDKNSKIY